MVHVRGKRPQAQCRAGRHQPGGVQDIIPLGQIDSMLRVQACLDEGMVLGVLGDRTLGGDPTSVCPS